MRAMSRFRTLSGTHWPANLAAQLEDASLRAWSAPPLPRCPAPRTALFPADSSSAGLLSILPLLASASSTCQYSTLPQCDASAKALSSEVAPAHHKPGPHDTSNVYGAEGGDVAGGAAPGAIGSIIPGGFGGDFTSGGLTLIVAGAVIAAAKKFTDIALELAQRQFLLRVEFNSRDDSYRWLLQWLAAHPDFQDCTTLSATTSLARFGNRASGAAEEEAGRKQGVLYFPAPGWHLIRFRGRWVFVSRVRGSPAQAAAQPSNVAPPETLTMTMLGRSRALLDELIEEARAQARERECSRTVVYLTDPNGYWTRTSSRAARHVRSVVLPEGVAARILGDCQGFLDSEEWYAAHGVPYRRGYLLHGAPGTGKTSLVTALAGELGLSIYVINLSSPVLTDEALCELMASAAPPCILLLEDVDAAFQQREAGEVRGRVTFSGVLNAIDGVAAQEGSLLFMTTNHKERLDPALIRPGRVDVQHEFRVANEYQVRTFVRSFYTAADRGYTEADVEALVARIPADVVSIAQLQGFLMRHLHDPRSAAQDIHLLL